MQQQTTQSSAPTIGQAAPSERERFLRLYERESATTRKILAAYPGAQCDLKPHDRSNSAKSLASTFVVEQEMMLRALRHEPVLTAERPKLADNWDGLLAQFDAGRAEILRLLTTSGDDLIRGTVAFFAGPKQTADYPMADFLTFMTHDQIHHRGQLSVYLRLAGAKVPSIYGPSADEPWN